MCLTDINVEWRKKILNAYHDINDNNKTTLTLTDGVTNQLPLTIKRYQGNTFSSFIHRNNFNESLNIEGPFVIFLMIFYKF